MAKIPFNVNAYTARLIGRENVSKLEGAVLELVKNTYDAEASVCLLYYEHSSKTLYLADNGYGMTKDVINQHWMTIGNSSKKSNYTTDTGRIQTGAKGIGRFALDRISDSCKMLTKTLNSSLEWGVSWDAFDTEKNITEIYADLDDVEYSFDDFFANIKNGEVKKIVAESFYNTGTVFKLEQLRENWSDALVEKIKKNLATLIPPEINNQFQIYLFCENTSIEDAKVLIHDGLFSYDYKIEFSADEVGNTAIQIFRSEFDFGERFEEIMIGAGFTQDDRRYFCGQPIEIMTSIEEAIPKCDLIVSKNVGSFKGAFYFAKLAAPKEEEAIYFYKSFPSRKDLKETFGGIKIYRDNFRVRPYGESKTSNYDWLLLSLRKNKSPAGISHATGKWRVSADQMLGSVYISRVNIALPDQANREGIVETKEFLLFKEFLTELVQMLEKDRQYVCRLLHAYYEKTNQASINETEIFNKAEAEKKEKTAGNSSVAPKLIEVSKARIVIQSKDKIIQDLEDENRLLRALATTGIITNTYIHEIKGMSHNLVIKIDLAIDALEIDNDRDTALKHLEAAGGFAKSFNSWFKVTLESIKRDKRTMRKVEMQPLIRNLVSAWRDAIYSKNINIVLDEDDASFRCFPFEIESIFHNLITNSVSSFNDSRIQNGEIKIKISQISQKDNGIIIEYSDNGSGLEGIYKKNPRRILEPFESSKRDDLGEIVGTGMGMWIVSKTVSEYNGKIDLTENINAHNGFFTKIILNSNRKSEE